MTQAILPTRLWGGSAEDRARREELSVPMLDVDGGCFHDKWILSNTRLGDGSARCSRSKLSTISQPIPSMAAHASMRARVSQ